MIVRARLKCTGRKKEVKSTPHSDYFFFFPAFFFLTPPPATPLVAGAALDAPGVGVPARPSSTCIVALTLTRGSATTGGRRFCIFCMSERLSASNRLRKTDE